MHIGIIIPAFNIAPWVGDAIRSVLQQDFTDWSLVVVDDGSADDTSSVVAGFNDPRISIIQQSNSGVSCARNRGAAAAAGDAVLFLDGDDWLAPDALACLSRTLDAAPCAVAAAGGYASVTAIGLVRRFAAPPHGMLLRRLLVRNLFVNGGHLLIRREAIEAAGGFDPALTYGEDWEYWVRLALLGAFVSVRNAEPLLFVRERADSAYRTMAFDPSRFTPCLDAVFGNPAVEAMIGGHRLDRFRRRAEAENAWVIGRELLRHGRSNEGRAWLARSLTMAPSLKRLGVLGLSWAGGRPFQPYCPDVVTTRDRQVATARARADQMTS
jgi:hypothetical protein